jgi:anaerobic nitric oxide reductase transcription regulator
MDQLDTILAMAMDLTSARSAEDRYYRLLETLRRVIPYDAAAILRLEERDLVPVVAHGLAPQALGRRFTPGEHPRLDIICKASEPVLFPPDTALPDPFDGLLEDTPGAAAPRIHACLGCPLKVGGELLGALTADAVDPGAFAELDQRFLAVVGAMAAAELRTTDFIEALERTARRQGRIAQDLMRDTHMRQGSQIIGVSPVMQKLRQEIKLVARSDLAVLVTGETGTGKELVVREIHAASGRSEEPLLYVNCAALPETLADSELFGHRRGAFTGATEDRPGKFEVADGGTLFLDEIGELPLSIQPKLLRALQQGEIQRVGVDRPLQVDVRVLAATNRDLAAEVQAGRFRADLLHRLQVYPITVPPLRERLEDLPLLAGTFCDLVRRRLGIGPVRLDSQAQDLLVRYGWPGNVRELDNVLSRATLRASSRVPRGEPVTLTPAHLDADLASDASHALRRPPPKDVDAPLVAPGQTLREATREFQRRAIVRAVAEAGDNWSAAARELGMQRGNLHTMAARLGLRS